VPQFPIPGLRSPVTDRQALRCQERVAYAGSAIVAARCARPPFGCTFRAGGTRHRRKAHAAGRSGGAAAGGGRSETGLQGSVPAEAVHWEGRCAASGEAPDRSVPLRYGEGGQRSRGGCSGPRMPGS